MAGLVVEEKIGFELGQEFAFGQAAQEHRFIDLDVPVHQRANRALMRRGAARSDQRSADAHAGGARLLQALECRQQRLELSGQQRLLCLVLLVFLKSTQTIGLVNALGFVAEQHGVAVKRDAYLKRVCSTGMGRLGIDLSRRYTGPECRAYITQMS